MDTIIFDLDGVIIDSEPLKKKAEIGAIKKHGLIVPDESVEAYLKSEPEPDGSHFRKFVEKHGDISHEELYSTRVGIYHHLIENELTTIPGALDFLDHVNERFAKTGLSTSSYIHNVVPTFDRFKLYKYFDAIISGTDVDKFKPHPEPYLRALEKLNSKSEETIVVEDAPAGIQSAKEAGCMVIGITTSVSAAKLKRAQADHVVKDFNEAKKVIDGIQAW